MHVVGFRATMCKGNPAQLRKTIISFCNINKHWGRKSASSVMLKFKTKFLIWRAIYLELVIKRSPDIFLVNDLVYVRKYCKIFTTLCLMLSFCQTTSNDLKRLPRSETNFQSWNKIIRVLLEPILCLTLWSNFFSLFSQKESSCCIVNSGPSLCKILVCD